MGKKRSRKKSKKQVVAPIGVSKVTPKPKPPSPPPAIPLTRWQKFRMRWLGR